MTTSTQLALLQNEIRRRYDTLSNRLKQVACYILDNSNSIPFETITSIAEKVNVPPSTLVRFATAFNFNGFHEMKQVFRGCLLEDKVSYIERARLFRQTLNHEVAAVPEKPMEILNIFSMINGLALQQLPGQINEADLNRAVELLANASNIYVIGLRHSFSIAAYLTYALWHLERRAFLIDGLGGMFNEQLSIIQPGDVMIAISYSPYAQEVLELASFGAKSGAKQIAITDSIMSPLAAFSDICFVVHEAQVGGFRSQVSSMCLSQTLMLSLAVNNAHRQIDRIRT